MPDAPALLRPAEVALRWRRAVLGWLRRFRRDAPVDVLVAELDALATAARHPYAAEIEVAKAAGGFKMLNCRMERCTLDGRRLPAGEVGPQCDGPEGVQFIAWNDEWAYADDGERYPIRAPRRRR